MSGKKFLYANKAACFLAAVWLGILFFYPHFAIKRLTPELVGGAKLAEEKVLAEDWEGAAAAFEETQAVFGQKKAFLKMFFNHEDVDELSVAFETCGAMLAIEESQALAELARIANISQYLCEIEMLSWYNFL